MRNFSYDGLGFLLEECHPELWSSGNGCREGAIRSISKPGHPREAETLPALSLQLDPASRMSSHDLPGGCDLQTATYEHASPPTLQASSLPPQSPARPLWAGPPKIVWHHVG